MLLMTLIVLHVNLGKYLSTSWAARPYSCLPACPLAHMPACLPACLPTCPLTCPLACAYMPACLPAHPQACLPACPHARLPARLPVLTCLLACLPAHMPAYLDLYNASKISIHQIQIQFLNINQEFQKFFTDCLFVRLPYVIMKHLPYVVSKCLRRYLPSVYMNFQHFKVSFLSSKCLFRFFPRSTDFPSLPLLLAGHESNGLCPDPLAGPRSCQRAPRWVQRCARFWWLTCHFGERT
jgi:hypothetical protein